MEKPLNMNSQKMTILLKDLGVLFKHLAHLITYVGRYLLIMKEQISMKKVIDNELCEENREVSVPVGGPLCTNLVIPATAKEGLRELSEIKKNAEETREVSVPDSQLVESCVQIE